MKTKGPSVVIVSPCNPSMLDPRIGPPLGCLYLVAWARQNGWDVDDWKIIDLNVECYDPEHPNGHWTHDFSIDRCMREIPGGADIYAIQLASMQMPHGVAIANRLREREPGALLVCGGSHASAMPDECAEWFDVVVEREGEKPFLELLKWRARRGTLGELMNMEGNRRRQWNGESGWQSVVMRHTPIDPLDDLSFPARDFLDFSRYTRKIAGYRATNQITSRGCPAACVFCQQSSLWGNQGLRMQSPGRILAEVDHIKETTKITNLLFLDDSLTARKTSDMVDLCEGLADRGVKWRGWTRANLIARKGQEKILKLMADSGCQAICVGVEAASDRLLKAMDKGTTVEQNEIALKRIAEAGMDARCSIMVGNPSETWEDVEALVRFIERMRWWVSDWILSSFVPLPGTPAWDEPERFGYVIDKQKARDSLYEHFYIVGGKENSPYVHKFIDGTGPEDFDMRHSYVQESLLRLAPRERRRVTIGDLVEAA